MAGSELIAKYGCVKQCIMGLPASVTDSLWLYGVLKKGESKQWSRFPFSLPGQWCIWDWWPVLAVLVPLPHWPLRKAPAPPMTLRGGKKLHFPPQKMDGWTGFVWHKSSDEGLQQLPEHSRLDNNCGLIRNCILCFNCFLVETEYTVLTFHNDGQMHLW